MNKTEPRYKIAWEDYHTGRKDSLELEGFCLLALESNDGIHTRHAHVLAHVTPAEVTTMLEGMFDDHPELFACLLVSVMESMQKEETNQ